MNGEQIHPQEINFVESRNRMTDEYVALMNEAYINECIVGQEKLGAAQRHAINVQALRQLAAHGVHIIPQG
jgi:hypothetical protein